MMEFLNESQGWFKVTEVDNYPRFKLYPECGTSLIDKPTGSQDIMLKIKW